EVALVVGKLVGMHDLDKISEDVSSCLRGIYNSLAVVSSQVSLNGTNFEFCLENVDKSYRFVVKGKDVSPFLSKNVNEIKLSKNLVWDTNATPMLSVIGHTRSGKTVFADYLLKVMSAQGWEIHYYSAKPDIYVKRFKGESDPRKIVEAVEQWNKIMSERNNEITKAGARTFTELGMKKIGLFIDELGLLNGRLSVDKKLERRWIAAITGLMGAGASSGITVVALSQRATKDYFLPSSALVNAKDAVIMLGLAADSGDDRRALIPGFDIAHCAYGQGQGLAMIVSSGSHWEQPEFYETPYFKELEKKDKNKS
ncbi:MAG: cell division protein FtsK, partial [Lactobacillus sp.]|nr:cell division protein FtsK [Lactobacillus sp.]